MARFSVNTGVKAEKELTTPLEIFGGLLCILALALSWFLVVVVRKSDNTESEKAYKIVRILSLAAVFYLLSLYWGLQLGVIAWFKNKRAVPVRYPSNSALAIAS